MSAVIADDDNDVPVTARVVHDFPQLRIKIICPHNSESVKVSSVFADGDSNVHVSWVTIMMSL